jgi:iron-sulfur cluster assembly accessory protein
MNITITPAAEKFMRRMVRFGGVGADGGFRLTVTPGGCSGYSSEFSVETGPQAGDAALDVNGLKVFLPAQSRLMLDGFTVDFADTPMESGLTFVNPNAASCGTCGTSGATGSNANHASAKGGATLAKIDVASITRRA